MEDINETPGSTPNFRTELAEKLAELVPEAIADGKVDVVKLKELLQEDAGDETERFGLFWPGKRRAMRAAQEPTTATLRPDKENSEDWDTTQNVFVEGDNLEVLKILQKHYHNKIKLIYIDPPYNTGKDFVYPDNYKEGLDSYLEWTRQVNEDGKKVSTNSESEGRYHSNWLNMMYPRLKLARNLLRADGAIFISIDDNEFDNLRKLCNEIFGESNFLGCAVWQKKYSPQNDAKRLSELHEYVLAFARNASVWRPNLLKRSDEAEARYKNPDNDPRGPWKMGDLTSKTKAHGHSYPITSPSGKVHYPTSGRQWAPSQSTFNRLLEENRIWFGAHGDNVPALKQFLSEVQSGTVPTTLWLRDLVGDNQLGVRQLSDLSIPFDSPKPTTLIQHVLKIGTDVGSEDIVLDFFGGSGTTAHSVMEQNRSDGGNRRFVVVQLPEPTPEQSDAFKAGFASVSDIARRRIVAAKNVFRDSAKLLSSEVDCGFRAFKLEETNLSKWRVPSSSSTSFLEEHLFSLRDSAKDDATPDDLLIEVLLKQGYSLTETITESEIAGLRVQIVGKNLIIAYLLQTEKPSLDQVRAIVAHAPARIIMLEDAFQGDDELKTNLAQLCKSKGIELWTA